MRDNDESLMSSEDRVFVDRFRRLYGSGSRTPATRVVFNQRLEARLRRRRAPWQPLAAVAGGLILAVGIILADPFGKRDSSSDLTRRSDGELLLALAVEQPTSRADNEMLPESYGTLASLLEY